MILCSWGDLATVFIVCTTLCVISLGAGYRLGDRDGYVRGFKHGSQR